MVICITLGPCRYCALTAVASDGKIGCNDSIVVNDVRRHLIRLLCIRLLCLLLGELGSSSCSRTPEQQTKNCNRAAVLPLNSTSLYDGSSWCLHVYMYSEAITNLFMATTQCTTAPVPAPVTASSVIETVIAILSPVNQQLIVVT